MKARKVYEFVKNKGIKADIGINVLERRSIEEWFAKWAPESNYTINDNLQVFVPSTLIVTDKNMTYLPDNLTVKGTLSIQDSGVTELPNNLRVKEILDTRKTGINKWPSDLSVGREIWSDHGIKK